MKFQYFRQIVVCVATCAIMRHGQLKVGASIFPESKIKNKKHVIRVCIASFSHRFNFCRAWGKCSEPRFIPPHQFEKITKRPSRGTCNYYRWATAAASELYGWRWVCLHSLVLNIFRAYLTRWSNGKLRTTYITISAASFHMKTVRKEQLQHARYSSRFLNPT